MFSQELIDQKLIELNEAYHACAEAGEGSGVGESLQEMERTVAALDAAQDWFKDRNIKLVYDGETGDYSLASEQPTWRYPGQRSPSYGEYLERLERSRRRHRW